MCLSYLEGRFLNDSRGIHGADHFDAQNFHISLRLYFLLPPLIFIPGPILLGYISHISNRRAVGVKDFVTDFIPIIIVLLGLNLLTDKSLF